METKQSHLERLEEERKAIVLIYLKDFQSKPLNENFDGKVADAFNQVIAYIEEFEEDN